MGLPKQTNRRKIESLKMLLWLKQNGRPTRIRSPTTTLVAAHAKLERCARGGTAVKAQNFFGESTFANLGELGKSLRPDRKRARRDHSSGAKRRLIAPSCDSIIHRR